MAADSKNRSRAMGGKETKEPKYTTREEKDQFQE
jgi:hypothetical protein